MIWFKTKKYGKINRALFMFLYIFKTDLFNEKNS